MNSIPTSSEANVNTKKLVVIGLLACLLIVVLWQNLGGKAEQPATSLVPVSAPMPTNTVAPRVPLTQALATWPAVELPQLLAHNPFQTLELLADNDVLSTDGSATPYGAGLLPTGADDSDNATEAATITDAIQINAILSGGPRPAVLIGQRLYFEQDEVAGQWRVVRIQPNRVSLLPLKTEDNTAAAAAEPISVPWSAHGRQTPNDDQPQ